MSQQDRWRIWESGKSRTGTRATDGLDPPTELKLFSSPEGKGFEERDEGKDKKKKSLVS